MPVVVVQLRAIVGLDGACEVTPFLWNEGKGLSPYRQG